MKRILLRCILVLVILLLIRFIYVNVVNVPFFEGVFISTTLGIIIALIGSELFLNKSLKRR